MLMHTVKHTIAAKNFITYNSYKTYITINTGNSHKCYSFNNGQHIHRAHSLSHMTWHDATMEFTEEEAGGIERYVSVDEDMLRIMMQLNLVWCMPNQYVIKR